MKSKQWICIWSFSFMLLILLSGDIHAANPKSEKIRNKMIEILSLTETILEKNVRAMRMRSRLEEQMAALKKEIEGERKRLGISSYREAIHAPRIYYDLKLVQLLLAYILKFNERIADLQFSSERLKFLYQQADDELKIAETLNDIEAEDLMNQIDNVVREHAPEAGNSFFDVKDVVLTNPEKIWDEIVNKRY